MNHRSPIQLSRSYTQTKQSEQVLPLTNDLFYHKGKYGFDLLEIVDTEVTKCYMDEYIVERFSRHSMKELRKLDIWDEVFLKTYGLNDPQRRIDKWIHSYLRNTALKKDKMIVRLIDNAFKKLY